MLPWILSGLSLAVAVHAWVRARRTAARLEELSQQYWQLRYEAGELRVQVERLAAPPAGYGSTRAGSGPLDLAAAAPARADAFVPLTSLKR